MEIVKSRKTTDEVLQIPMSGCQSCWYPANKVLPLTVCQLFELQHNPSVFQQHNQWYLLKEPSRRWLISTITISVCVPYTHPTIDDMQLPLWFLSQQQQQQLQRHKNMGVKCFPCCRSSLPSIYNNIIESSLWGRIICVSTYCCMNMRYALTSFCLQ